MLTFRIKKGKSPVGSFFFPSSYKKKLELLDEEFRELENNLAPSKKIESKSELLSLKLKKFIKNNPFYIKALAVKFQIDSDNDITDSYSVKELKEILEPITSLMPDPFPHKLDTSNGAKRLKDTNQTK
jgi:hypothetical protein